MIFDIPCVIFAGGKSSRMGQDKALLTFRGKPLALYQYERLKPLFKKTYISTKDDKFDFDAEFIYDKTSLYAPMPVIGQILEDMGDFFAISVDTPFIDEKIISKIVEADKECEAIVAKTTRPHPLIGIYKKSFLPRLNSAINAKNLKLNSLLKKADTVYVEFEEEDSFLNLNYPKDFQKALKIL